MTKLKLKDYDPARYINTKEDITDFIEDAVKTNDPKIIANALLVVSRANLEGDAMGPPKRKDTV